MQTNSYSDANTFSDPNRDSYANGDRYSDGNCNANSDSDAYGNFDPMHREMFTHAAAPSDTRTSTVMDAGLATESFLPKHSPEQRVLTTATEL